MRSLCRQVIVALISLPATFPLFAGFGESPQLHDRVVAGELPPLEQRLPIAPLVVTPVEQPGRYGGTWRMVVAGYTSNSLMCRTLAYEPLVRWDRNWTRVVPNLAISWTINEDATVYRFQLRRGVRWSDGALFTAKDIVAWMDDVARDPELTPVPPGWLTFGGGMPVCSAPDDETVEFRFGTPNALFLETLASMNSYELTRYPAHYFRKVHRRHSPDGAAELVRQTGLPWDRAFRTVYAPWTWRHVGAPTLDPWQITTAYVPGVPTVIAVRNPYYWKVDTVGRQLPYLDRVTFEVVSDAEEILRREIAGEVDYSRPVYSGMAATPAIMEAERAGRIRTVRVVPSGPNPIALFLNLTHRDPAMRAALSDRRVREALSEAINRPRIIHQLYGNAGRAWQIAPRPESPFLNRRLGEQYTEYAPGRSRAALDAAGLTVRGPDGLRCLPDGRPFHLHVLVPAPFHPDWKLILEMLQADWLALGVRVDWEGVERTDFNHRLARNEHDAAILAASGGYAPLHEPECFLPATTDREWRVPYATPWALWFIDPAAPGAERPPEIVVKQLELFRRAQSEPRYEVRSRLMAEVLEIAADQFYAMGICLEQSRVAVRTPGFRNFPSSHFNSWICPDPGVLNPCQFYQDNTVGSPP